MVKRISNEIEEKILDLLANGKLKTEIAKIVGCKRNLIYKVIKRNTTKPHSSIKKINQLISLRLLHFCDDTEILIKMLASEIKRQNLEEIIIPYKVEKNVDKNKLDNIVNILEAVVPGKKITYQGEKIESVSMCV